MCKVIRQDLARKGREGVLKKKVSRRMGFNGRGSCLTGTMVLALVVPALFLEAGPLEEGLALFDQREDLRNAYESIRIWEEALASAPGEQKYELYWRISAAYHFIATHEDGTGRERIVELLDRGQEAGRKGLDMNPEGVDALYWRSTNLAEKGEVQGILKSLFLVKPLKADMERVVELDPDYYKAFLLLGILYVKAPGWPLSIGSSQKGVETLEHAIHLNPKCLRCYLELARAHLKRRDTEKAREAAQALLDAGIEPGYEVETPEYRAQAEEILSVIPEKSSPE